MSLQLPASQHEAACVVGATDGAIVDGIDVVGVAVKPQSQRHWSLELQLEAETTTVLK